MGRQWLKLMAPIAATTRPTFIAAYPIRGARPGATPPTRDRLRAPRGLAQRSRRVAGRARWTAARCYEHLTATGAPRRTTASPALDRATRRRSTTPAERVRRAGSTALIAASRRRRRRLGRRRGSSTGSPCAAPRGATARSVLRRRGVPQRPPRLVQRSTSTRTRRGSATRRRRAPPDRSRRTTRHVPTPVALRRHAEHALVGVRGRPHELRRRAAPTPPTSASCCSSSSALVYANDWFLVPVRRCRSASSRTCAGSR